MDGGLECVYLAVWVDLNPSCAPYLIAYQRIITSTNSRHPLWLWLNYNVKFRIKAASNPSLRWDVHDSDLWLEYITTPSVQSTWWPCSYCGSTAHYPSNFSLIQALMEDRISSSTLLADLSQLPSSGQPSSKIQPLKPAMTIITQPAIVHSVNSRIGVRTVVETTQGQGSQSMGSLIPAKPLPWTPLWPFIFECELSNFPDKVFVRQLIDNLWHGCSIGYTSPQFTHIADNLQSASQQPEVIDATLKEECEAGCILGPFTHPPLPNFRTSGLGLVPMHDGGGALYTTSPHLLITVLMILSIRSTTPYLIGRLWNT